MRTATRSFLALASWLLTPANAQQSVCELIKDLKVADGRQVTLTGELIISKAVALLGDTDCVGGYITPDPDTGPAAVTLRPSGRVSPKLSKELKDTATQADRLRARGKVVSASAVFSGRIHVKAGFSDPPAELVFDSFENLKVEVLPDPGDLPVIPVCDLFRNLTSWKGKRIAVRGQTASTFEGSWMGGQCKETFQTNGYRWPALLSMGLPAYYSSPVYSLLRIDEPAKPSESEKVFRGRNSVVQTATYIGRLRLREEYHATCRAGGDWITNGFGHLNGATAEIVVEAIRDVELTPQPSGSSDEDPSPPCTPPNHAVLCANLTTLSGAVASNCVERVAELLARDGIDSKDGDESPPLITAIRLGNEAIVRLLLDQGSPVNPLKVRLSPPLAEAADRRNLRIMRMLLVFGADVEAKDNEGVSYLPNYGLFDPRVSRILLEAGANPNAMDSQGRTALMQASEYGYEDEVALLLSRRAEVNLKDRSGRTALMYAASGKYVDAIPLLLANRADVHARDADGKTALDIARKSKNKVAVELLSPAMNGTR